MPISVYQTIVSGSMVERTMRDHIKLWSPDYLAEVGVQHGRARADLPDFRSFLPALDLDKFDEDQVPSCVIVSPGTLEQPSRSGDGKYRTTWQVAVGCVVSGQDRDNTFELTQMYAAAVRACVVQHPSLGEEFIEGTSWLGERYDELDSSAVRTLMAGSVSFAVTVTSAVDSRGGTRTPLVDSHADPGGWTTVHVSGLKEEVRPL